MPRKPVTTLNCHSKYHATSRNQEILTKARWRVWGWLVVLGSLACYVDSGFRLLRFSMPWWSALWVHVCWDPTKLPKHTPKISTKIPKCCYFWSAGRSLQGSACGMRRLFGLRVGGPDLILGPSAGLLNPPWRCIYVCIRVCIHICI